MQSLKTIFQNPTTVVALIGVFLIIFALVKVRKVKITTPILTQIAVVLALSTVLKMFKFIHLPFGGSATLGSMVPIILIAIALGPEIGMLTGFLFGVITFVLDPWILHPVQVLFDYPLPFMALGFLAGVFRKNRMAATIVGIAARFLCHFISGAVFFGENAAPGQSIFAYSFLYNISYLGPDAIICFAIMAILPVKQLMTVINKAHA